MNSMRLCCVLFVCLFVTVDSRPRSDVNERSPLVVEYEAINRTCDQEEVSDWTNNFHNCFIDKKYSDGGRDLNTIVDRILEHAEACAEVSSKNCRPSFHGFEVILNKVISQMKDYAQIYLEAIYKDRDNIKDLECVESTLMLDSYQDCFENLFNSSDDNATFESNVEDSISCVNRRNRGCSNEARIALNRIVRKVLDVNQPDLENFEEEEKPEEQPWMWYDYLAYPFVTAWNAIKNFFGF